MNIKISNKWSLILTEKIQQETTTLTIYISTRSLLQMSNPQCSCSCWRARPCGAPCGWACCAATRSCARRRARRRPPCAPAGYAYPSSRAALWVSCAFWFWNSIDAYRMSSHSIIYLHVVFVCTWEKSDKYFNVSKINIKICL